MESKTSQLKSLDANWEYFQSLFNKDKHDELVKNGRRKLSFKAMQAALFINMYQQEPVLQLPFRLLDSLLEIDEQLTLWRHRHSLMVHRMIGSKIGTGGSSGYHYLKATAIRH